MTVPHPRNPLVLTLSLDKSTQSFLTNLRAKYFPKHRNFLAAHVTLFHAIPAHRIDELDRELNTLCQKKTPWDVFICDPQTMGNRGVMVTVRERPSGKTANIHSILLSHLKKGVEKDEDRLTNQDMQRIHKPHVTVLNKAEDPEEVQRCLEEVQELFAGMHETGGQQRGRAVGFEVWEYMGGPWKSLKTYPFSQHPQGPSA